MGDTDLGIIRTDTGKFLDKGNMVINVKHPDFEGGAKGDGVTDDTRAIQAAIRHLRHSGPGGVSQPGGTAGAGIPGVGGVIYFPPGIYSVTGLTVTAASKEQNITFKGAGPLASVIRNDATDGSHAIEMVGTSGDTIHGTKFEDIGIHGNASSGNGLYFNNRTARQIELNRVDIFDHGDNGVEFFTTCNMIVFRSCRIRNNTNSGIRTAINGEQIWMYGNSIRDNATGVSIGSYVNICNIYGGDIHGNDMGVSIFGGDADDAYVTAITLDGIYFEENKEDILVDNAGTRYYAGNIVIRGNSFTQTTPDSTGYTIEVRRGRNVIIEHNEFRKMTDADLAACIRVGSEAQDVYLGFNLYNTIVSDTLDAAAAVDKGGGLVGIPVTGHAFREGHEVTISGTTNYDGTFRVESVTKNEIVITDTYNAETFAGTETVVSDGNVSRPLVSIDADATRVWGYTRPDTSPSEFNAWGTMVAGNGLAIGSKSVQTISTGALDVSGTLIAVAAESGTTDTLDYIEIPDEDGRIVILKADVGDTITVADNTGSVPAGYAALQISGSFAALDENDSITLYYESENTKWKEISRSAN